MAVCGRPRLSRLLAGDLTLQGASQPIQRANRVLDSLTGKILELQGDHDQSASVRGRGSAGRPTSPGPGQSAQKRGDLAEVDTELANRDVDGVLDLRELSRHVSEDRRTGDLRGDRRTLRAGTATVRVERHESVRLGLMTSGPVEIRPERKSTVAFPRWPRLEIERVFLSRHATNRTHAQIQAVAESGGFWEAGRAGNATNRRGMEIPELVSFP